MHVIGTSQGSSWALVQVLIGAQGLQTDAYVGGNIATYNLSYAKLHEVVQKVCVTVLIT